MPRRQANLLQGALDLPVLKALSLKPFTVWASPVIEPITKGTLCVSDGALVAVRHRLEIRGRLKAGRGSSQKLRRATRIDSVLETRDNSRSGNGNGIESSKRWKGLFALSEQIQDMN